MPRFRVKIWTGPTTVQEIASRMREAGIADVSAGTEHVYAMVEATERGAAVHNLCVDLERKHGTSYGIGSYRHGDHVSAEPEPVGTMQQENERRVILRLCEAPCGPQGMTADERTALPALAERGVIVYLDSKWYVSQAYCPYCNSPTRGVVCGSRHA